MHLLQKNSLKLIKVIINPLISGVKKSAHRGISSLSKKAHETVDKLQQIEGERIHKKERGRKKKGTGVIGDVLKGILDVTGLGVKHHKNVVVNLEPKERVPGGIASLPFLVVLPH